MQLALQLHQLGNIADARHHENNLLLLIEDRISRDEDSLPSPQFLDDREARTTARTSPDRPISEFELGTRPIEALAKAGISTVLVGLAEYSHIDNAIRWAEKGPLAADVVERLVALEAED